MRTGRFFGYGGDFEDYDNDGRPDVFTLPWRIRSTLLRNVNGASSTRLAPTGVAAITPPIPPGGAKFIDYDNDG
jgi:hypothetical protein